MDIKLSKLKSYPLNHIQHRWIYYLYNKWKLVYIWQSENIYQRIFNHIYEWEKEFDKFRFIDIPLSDDLDNIEISEIKKYKPLYNKNIYNISRKNRLKVLFNLIRRLWYNIPKLSYKIYKLSDDKLIEYIISKTWLKYNNVKYLTSLKHNDIVKLQLKVGNVWYNLYSKQKRNGERL